MDAIYHKLAGLCKTFRIPGELEEYRLLTSGHINTTYYARVINEGEIKEYLIQMVNWYVFKEPVSMMHNIDMLTCHIMAKEPSNERRRSLHFHHTAEGNNYQIVDNNGTLEFWRLSNFIEDSVSFDSADGNPDILRQSGKAFGRFGYLLSDFDATQLSESIPHFHDTRYRLDNFFRHVEEDSCGRVAECGEEIAVIRKYRGFACTLNEMFDKGELPIRTTHNDTKTNNVLFDKDTLEPLVVIDLDTCMPGLYCHDFGDTIRFAACRGTEDTTDLSLMKVDFNLYRAFCEGYIGETASILTDNEIKSMALGAAIITLELAMRFLDDYITGDLYFKIDYPTHNLVRARSQMALFLDMYEHLDEMDRIVHEVAGR